MEQKFMDWCAKFGKNYEDMKGLQKRKEIFDANSAKVDALNAKFNKKGVTFANNWISDMEKPEVEKMLGLSVPQDARGEKLPDADDSDSGKGGRRLASLSDPIDYRGTGILTPVKNQGGCGSCWAFAATKSMEAVWAKKYNEAPVRMSE